MPLSRKRKNINRKEEGERQERTLIPTKSGWKPSRELSMRRVRYPSKITSGSRANKQVHSKTILNLKQIIAADNTKFRNSIGAYGSIESGISVKPTKKYCVFTGFHSKYCDKKTGLRYFSAELYNNTVN